MKAEALRDIGNGEGVGMLHQAAAVGNIEQVRFLLEMCGLNPSLRTRYRWAPLHWEVNNCSSAVVRILLPHGANPSPRSDTGRTPLDIARITA
ncbi:ankyrin [Terfezia boudieri ATCC MYA-4762]|uniref:Ankyrin n=1 Tax=Terfezia boudieri ATCC MYA-4762 TaxID=1051890 RepID=A0A3N4LSR5_9PEZI|nr:ankyrin [Terfezia boudieri ATCC MYA-4762]